MLVLVRIETRCCEEIKVKRIGQDKWKKIFKPKQALFGIKAHIHLPHL